MVFNGDANGMDLCTLADNMLGDTDDVDFTLAKKALYATWGLREIFKIIYSVYGGWVLQDSNVTGEDTVTKDLLSNGTQFYAFPTVSWLNGMEYEDENGDKFPLIPITLEGIREMGYAEDEFMKTPGRPQYYRPVKNGVKIYPSSDAAVTGGLIAKIGAQDIAVFTPSTTDTEPGYDSLAGHEAVAAFMAMKFADFNEMTSFSKRKQDWMELSASVKSHYMKKFREHKPAIRTQPMGGNYVNGFVS